jgi:Zn-dependent M28 family amino/carboxypeptidase
MVEGAAGRLRHHVQALAGDIGPRCMTRRGTMDRAARYIADALAATGLLVARDVFDAGQGNVANLSVTARGTETDAPMVLVGAHYDSCHGTPGADDNASGVAGLLELAARLASTPARGPVRFVAFANEEAPYFATPAMGSLRCSTDARARGERISLMLSLEMLGYFTDAPRSQRYPPLYGIGRPKQGNFIGVVGKLGSGGLLRRIERAFKQASSLGIQIASAPEWVEGVSLSDHWAFWQAGYPAVMVTDTAFYRNPHYHTQTDTWDTLDYAKMAQTIDGLQHVIAAFAG